MPRKNVGIFALLLLIVVVATAMDGNFVAAANLKTLIRDTSLYALISIGVAMVVITGGIDLSIGSMIALCGVMMVQIVNVRYERDPNPATIDQITRPADGPTLIRLRQTIDPIRGGDRLIYASVVGESRLVLTGMLSDATTGMVSDATTGMVSDATTGILTSENPSGGAGDGSLMTDDPARSLRPGTSVIVERLRHTSPLLACAVVLVAGGLLGWLHGILVARVHLQPFVVTLCGLLIYRGLARVWTGDDQVGLGAALSDFKAVVTGSPFSFPLPMVAWLSGDSSSWWSWTWIDFPFTGVLLVVVATAAWLFLQHTVAGRHLLATGENERAARYSGVATTRLIVSAYVISGLLSALAGILFLLEWNSVQPGSSGNFYELYAIAAAVLGGCSLRGGRGAVIGVIAGAAVMRCLYKAIVVLGIDQQWEMVIIGVALLGSVVVDEIIRRFRGP